MSYPNVISHGIDFIIHGKCERCGACEKPNCPHFTWEDGLATCKVYGRKEYFELNCHVFPNSPFCDVVRKGICGYTFEPVTEDGARMYRKILESIEDREAKR
jgi:hypothetical protein